MFMYQRSAAVSTYRACSPTSSEPRIPAPAALNEAVKAAAERHQVPASQLHFEQFILEDKSGGIYLLARSGRVTVPQDMTILQVIENNSGEGRMPVSKVCGTCETMILEGRPPRSVLQRGRESQPAEYADLLLARQRRPVLDL